MRRGEAMSTSATARVRANDWSTLRAPVPGAYEPHVTVTVVIPAFRAARTLPYTLASLAAQSYPSHLVEVVVVDDGGDNPVTLPDLRPERVKVVSTERTWGRAEACRVGALAAEGDVVHWLDADMVPDRDEVAQQSRWHHVAQDAVVLGHKLFVDAERLPEASEVYLAAQEGRLAQLFDGRWIEEHGWVEEIWRRSDDLVRAGFRAFHVHVGSTASVRRDLYLESGGMDPAMKLGEDIELGYRLAAKGAVFVGAREATSWHLGPTLLMRQQQDVQRYNAPFIAQRVPDFRKFRTSAGRSYAVPYVEAVVEARGEPYERVRFTVDGLLAAGPGDLRCLVVGDWGELHDARRDVLGDPAIDARLICEEYAHEPRVQLVRSVEETAFPAQFRLWMPVGWRPVGGAVEPLCREVRRKSLGLRAFRVGEGQVARLEVTAAFERALRARRPGEELDRVVAEVAGARWSDADGRFECDMKGDVHSEASRRPR